MLTTAFLRDLGERAVATFAQALAALLLADGTGILNTNWRDALSVAGMAALLAVLKGVGAYGLDHETGASALTNPPPRVERGHFSPLYVVLVVLLVVLILAVLGLV